jgi:hypothetical protein
MIEMTLAVAALHRLGFIHRWAMDKNVLCMHMCFAPLAQLWLAVMHYAVVYKAVGIG